MFVPPFVSRGLQRLDDVVRRRGVWSLYGLLKETQYWDRSALEDLQHRKLRHLMAHVASNSPYYANLLRRSGVAPDSIRGIEDLRVLPALTKADARTWGTDIRARGGAGRRPIPNSTGGSTGLNLDFQVDRNCHRWRDAVDLRLWDIIGVEAGVPALYLWGSPMDERAFRKVSARVRAVIDNRRLRSAYRIGEAGLVEFARYVNSARPRVIFGYPSVLDLLATAVRDLRAPWPRDLMPTIVASAEEMFPEQRRNIEESLGAKVINLYGCREFGLVALECAEGGRLHVMEERLVVELLPDESDDVRRVVITDLDNLAFPFIRYEIGDLTAAGEEPCPCGRTLRTMGVVRGRAFDVVRGPNGNAVGGTFWSLLLRTAVSGVASWQVVQRGPASIEVRVTPRDALSDADRERLVREVRGALGEEVRLDLVQLERLEPLPSGKHRFVVAWTPDGSGGPRA